MLSKKIVFPSAKVDYYLEGSLSKLSSVTDRKGTVILTDENVYTAHTHKFKGWNTIVLKAGEEFKVQQTVDSVVEQLIDMEADRSFTLVGVGGGVITDLAGYIGSVYMRGIRTGFVPTTLLAMVDASIGGKNGIDVGVYKNMVGVIRQPGFLLWDHSLLSTLPLQEWQNGFAEIIKHGAILDAAMFRQLEQSDVTFYQKKKKELQALVRRNALLKTKLVQKDERETGDRKLLNFGHTLGHALENQYELSHGQAISIGMTYAAQLSQKELGFRGAERVISLLEQYGLPTYAGFNRDKMIGVLRMDKKRQRDAINFILLQRIGKAVIQPLTIEKIYEQLT